MYKRLINNVKKCRIASKKEKIVDQEIIGYNAVRYDNFALKKKTNSKKKKSIDNLPLMLQRILRLQIDLKIIIFLRDTDKFSSLRKARSYSSTF